MSELLIFGISGNVLASEQRPLLKRCAAVVVSRRFSPLIGDLEIPTIPIAPVRDMVEAVARALERGSVAILASGDPLFFGIGRTMIQRFGPERVRIFPALSAMQLACAKFKVPWDDLTMMSLHGRDPDGLAGRILPHARVMLFTDHRNSPDRIARRLLARLEECADRQRIEAITVRVAENLGLADERLSQGSLAEIAAARFDPLNMMLIEQEAPGPDLPVFGLKEDEIRHSRGLITKDEVRAVVLHCLRLPEQGVLWDVGGGSGSVSLAAARLAPGLDIFTVEKTDEGLENIRRNIARFNLYNIRVIAGEAPEVLVDLPDPDRVFIGGSGGRLDRIIEHCAARLESGGRLVATAVLADTARRTPELMRGAGLEVDLRRVSVVRQQAGREEKTFNPITIITGRQ